MNKTYFPFTACLCAVIIWSCNNSSTSTSESKDSSNNSSTANATDTTNTMNNSANSGTSNNTSSNTTGAPLGKSDSMFVMEAAAGGMMEVEAGNVAQQNAMSQRVKDFGAMMVRDHSKANDELKSFASSRGLTVPSALPADMQKHLDAMKKMTGKAFDQHYVSMMVQDHNEDIGKFKKESTSGTDADLKNWAAKTLPTLQVHKDSIDAIKKGKM
jgi:putative membrane protein